MMSLIECNEIVYRNKKKSLPTKKKNPEFLRLGQLYLETTLQTITAHIKYHLPIKNNKIKNSKEPASI